MSLRIIDAEQRSQEWHEARRGILTASSIGQLVGPRRHTSSEVDCPGCLALPGAPCVSTRTGAPIRTAHPERAAAARDTEPTIDILDTDAARDLVTRLVSERITGWVEDTYQSAAMMRGILDEPVARQVYSEHIAPVIECGLMVRDDDGIRVGYSPDGLVGDDGLIEIKSRIPKRHLADILAGVVPAEHVAQVQTGLYVSGRAWCDYVSYSGGMPLWTVRMTPDPQWADAIRAAAVAFETVADRMTTEYLAAVAGRPATERTTYDLAGIEF